jgi:site-specific recombinase
MRLDLPFRRVRAQRRWDLTALLNAADPKASQPERHLWLVRLLEWLRHAPSATGPADADPAAPSVNGSPMPLRRLRHLLGVLDRHPEHEERIVGLLRAFRREIDVRALLADFGFAPTSALFSELKERLRAHLLPGTPATSDLAELFGLLFTDAADADWLAAMDEATLASVGRLFRLAAPEGQPEGWREPVIASMMSLAAQISAAGGGTALRRRMSPERLAAQPFRQLLRSTERLCAAAEAGDAAAQLHEAQFLRLLLDACRQAAASVREHLQEHGISVELLFQVDQLHARARRMEALLGLLLAPGQSPELRREVQHLLAGLVQVAAERRSVRALLARQYSMLAREIAERSAETGEHYITRDRGEWLVMLRKACGGGAVIAGTTFVKFFVVALGLSAFWGGFWAGVNYAASFVLVHLMHWTVATKQPAMTAPAMAAKLGDVTDDAAIEGFVDEAAHLIRSQTAGIVGNLMVVFPLVLGVQLLCGLLFGGTPVNRQEALYVLHSVTLLGPTLFFAAFTGVLLFASSLVAGWAENWFVLRRLDSALRWNPRILGVLGARRAADWSVWWRDNISGIAANVSLGFMLGIVPVVGTFFGLPVEVRHVTLSTGQIGAALGALGLEALRIPDFWWCVAAIPLTGALNLGVSFWLAFSVAARSRNVRVTDRSRIGAALRRRLRSNFASFLLPPRQPPADPG